MPLLTLDEIKSLSPIFRGNFGSAVGKGLMKWLSVDKLNDLYDRNSSHRGPDFAEAILKDLGIKYELINPEVLDSLPDGPFITISNHPYGSIDGIILVDVFGHLRPDYKVMVNNILSRIKTLDENFISVTPTGNIKTAPTKESLSGIKEALSHVRSGHPLGLFPSGAVSDLSLKEGCIRDREWQEPVIRLIKKLRVPVIPVHFLDRNSDFYYSLGLIDWKVRLLRLPGEVFNKRDKTTRVAFGKPISPEHQDAFKDTDSLRAFLRDQVYGA